MSSEASNRLWIAVERLLLAGPRDTPATGALAYALRHYSALDDPEAAAKHLRASKLHTTAMNVQRAAKALRDAEAEYDAEVTRCQQSRGGKVQ